MKRWEIATVVLYVFVGALATWLGAEWFFAGMCYGFLGPVILLALIGRRA